LSRAHGDLTRVLGYNPASDEDDDKVAYLTDREARGLASQYPDLIVEEDFQFDLVKDPALCPFHLIAAPGGSSLSVRTLDADSGDPVPYVTVYLIVDLVARIGYRTMTDEFGRAVVEITPHHRQFEMVALYPSHGYWNLRVESVTASSRMAFSLRPLAMPGEGGWGFAATGRPAGDGRGVRVGVIDSGIARTHPNLNPVGGRNFVAREPDHEWWNDEDGHGTHCAGLISSRRVNNQGFEGYAPAAAVYSYRAFGGADGGGYVSWINRAIKQALDDGCDLINLSLGDPQPAQSMRVKIQAVRQAGVLCVAAAGNSAGPVEYPGAFPETLAVAALGEFDTYPADSLHVREETNQVSDDRKYFATAFSCHGPEVEVIAPGLAIISTVPPAGYAAWDGTSMAGPHITGLAAALLSDHPAVLNMARDARRADAIRDLVLNSARTLGLPSTREGRGLPQV
jgi:subtilisin family serine protease